LIGEKEKSRLLQEEMEATLQDIQNMYFMIFMIFFSTSYLGAFYVSFFCIAK